MDEGNNMIPNVMPDVMVEPITDMEMIVAKLKHDGKEAKQSSEGPWVNNKNKEV